MCMVRSDSLVVQERKHSIIALEKEEDPKRVQKNSIPSFVCVLSVFIRPGKNHNKQTSVIK